MIALPPTSARRNDPIATRWAVVAAALLAFAILAAACGDARPTPRPPVSPAATPSPAAVRGRDSGRLLLLVGAPRAPRASVHDVPGADDAPQPIELPAPAESDTLVTIAAAPDGRLAAVTWNGAAWIAAPPADGASGGAWVPLPRVPAALLPGPVVGATWSLEGDGLILLAGDPGSGTRQTALLSLPVDGTAPTAVRVALEVDGPGIAALPHGQVAFVGRDDLDRGALGRIASPGSFVTLPVAARSVWTGGGLVALVDDTGVRLGTFADLDRGVLPERLLPLDDDAGFGAVAIAADGGRIAVVRLDDAGDAARVDLLRRTGDDWAGAGAIALDRRDGTAIPAWLP